MIVLSVWVWIVAGALWVSGLLLGAYWGLGRGRDQGYEEYELDLGRAQAMARRTHPVFRGTRGGTVMPYRPPEVHHEERIGPTGEGAGYMMGYRLSLNGQQVYDWQHDDPEPFSPEAAALALVRDDLTDSAYTQDMADRMDRFLNELFAVPYSADELWSGQ